MQIKIIANERGNPPGKLADAELHFDLCPACRVSTSSSLGPPHTALTCTCAPLAGLKLIGFAIWERRTGSGGRNVTFPARQYSINGERRSFALLRPIVDTTASGRIRELILQAYAEYEEREQEQQRIAVNSSLTVTNLPKGTLKRAHEEAEAKHANDLKF